jgi:penicillin-binding protein 2
MPPGYVEAQHYTEVKNVPIDPNGWNFITDAMSRVLLPEGTAPSAHIPGLDIAGKTGSAQIVSLATRARFKNSDDLAQNGWFVGFTPRRNPDIVVCVLFQGGEHGRLAARLATQVIKAYVDKQRRAPTKMVEKPKSNGTVDIGGLWTEPGSDGDKETLQAGHFVLDLPKKPLAVAVVAPGMHE